MVLWATRIQNKRQHQARCRRKKLNANSHSGWRALIVPTFVVLINLATAVNPLGRHCVEDGSQSGAVKRNGESRPAIAFELRAKA